MNIMTDYSAALKLKKMEILEGYFKKSEFNVQEDLSLFVSRQIKKINNCYDVFLDVRLSSEDDSISLAVKAKAVFETNISNEKLVERNGIAIMFPYVRSYVSLLTTQPGMPPIILPALNIIAMIEAQEKNRIADE